MKEEVLQKMHRDMFQFVYLVKMLEEQLERSVNEPLAIMSVFGNWYGIIDNNKDTKNMKKEKIYISGPIAHHEECERRRRFEQTAYYLSLKGYDVVNPMENGLAFEADWREHMRRDMGLLLQCDSLYMLKGWELSKGCKLELDVATSCGINVVFE